MRAIIRAFDVRPAVKEQVKSIGAEFLEVDIQEYGSTQGGYEKKGAVAELEAAKKEVNPFQDGIKQALTCTAGLGTISALGMGSPNAAFTNMSTTFSFGCIVVYHTVWSVVPALHSPLMSVTNAISGITAVGGLLIMRGACTPTTAIEGLEASAALIFPLLTSLEDSLLLCVPLTLQSTLT